MRFFQFWKKYEGEPLPTMTLLFLETANGGYTIVPNGEPLSYWQLQKAKDAIDEMLKSEGIEEDLDEWNKQFNR